MTNKETITKLLKKLHQRRHKPDLHSFKAKIAAGVVFVEAEEDAIFIEAFIYDEEGRELRERWCDRLDVAARRLECLGLDLATVET